MTLVAVMTLLAAACGSSDDNNPGPGTTSAPVTTAATTAATSTTTVTTTTVAPTTGGGEAEVEIQGFQYIVPASVPPGATVKVVNKDGPAHTVTSAKGRFDTEVAGNGTATFTAPGTAGTYDVVCTFHPNMRGQLVVK